MNGVWKKWLSAMCLLTAALFLFQTFSAFAEHAGLMPCAEHQAEHSDPTKKDNGNSTTHHCCGVHAPTLFASAVALPSREEPGCEVLPVPDDSCPDSLAREIDHPPQLS
jgi:hypothetical protein